MYSITVNGVTYTYNPANGGSVSSVGGTSKGTFDTTSNMLTITTTLGGRFVVNLDTGVYTYTSPATVTSTTAENIAYIIKDMDGDTANAALTINVTAPQVTTLTSSTTSISNMGLSGEYYGYNDVTTSSTSKSDTSKYNVQSADGTKGNIDSIAETIAIINAKQIASTSIVGSSTPVKASASATDAVFVATTLNYGSITSGNLGYNSDAVAATSGSLNSNTGDNLFKFLKNGVTAGGDALSLVATSSYGNTTDAIIRMLGSAYLNSGTYTFKVTADDGYSIYIDGKQVLAYDGNVDTATTSSSVALAQGLHTIEIIYWDQGGAANFSMSYSLDGVNTYLGFNSSNVALFQAGTAPALTELQDIVKDSSGNWVIRTGSEFTGSSVNDYVTGSDGIDHIAVGSGNDRVYAGTGNDIIESGTGNDYLDGGAGVDTILYSHATSGVTVNLSTGLATGGDGSDTITNVENVVGSNYNDTLVGDANANTIQGGAGNDILTGGAGIDTFKWASADKGTTTAVATDHVADFDKSTDFLDIKDLLTSVNSTNSTATTDVLKNYLSTSITSDGHLSIDIHNAASSTSTVLNHIVLDNVSISTQTAADQYLTDLITNNHLVIK